MGRPSLGVLILVGTGLLGRSRRCVDQCNARAMRPAAPLVALQPAGALAPAVFLFTPSAAIVSLVPRCGFGSGTWFPPVRAVGPDLLTTSKQSGRSFIVWPLYQKCKWAVGNSMRFVLKL